MESYEYQLGFWRYKIFRYDYIFLIMIDFLALGYGLFGHVWKHVLLKDLFPRNKNLGDVI